MIGMSPLMFYNCDSKPVGMRLAEVDHLRKSPQHGPTKISGKHHPPSRCYSDPQNQTFKLVNELSSKAGHARLIIIANRLEVAFDGGVVFDGHRSLAINSS